MADFDPATPNPQALPGRTDRSTPPTAEFVVQFWGVRGRTSAPGKDTIRYGGNTSCVEMRVGGKRLIFDGGTGLRVLGNKMLAQMPVEGYIFFTHSHWERIQGFPFFVPAFIRGNCFHIYGANAGNGESMQQCLCNQMMHPNFPVPIQVMQSDLKFYHLNPGDTVTLDDVTITTASLNDTNQAIGYRVTWHGHSAVYAVDAEDSPEDLNQNLLHLASDADLLICNATPGGHLHPSSFTITPSSEAPWQTSVALAKAAGVKQLVMFRHEPDYDDDFLDMVQEEIHAAFPNGVVAAEGMILSVF
ncbi:MBL fold metallo-hydrolase [Microcoleus sp. FACHB-831]|uniref:MBL fold metallo-hydrolase n=1 Tax=Microcoleus sp. FACHB-831 TaxID=2692827 RepID=UPI001689330A|nr:MBL fold metallo-hydrolase [Microcoleus sp. FACHB-831]MBD1920853.1 MBL fold metallo-hydrolase [Microcoleus sp. FACHB-831]